MGVGHVPQEPFRIDGQNHVVQRREHRGTSSRKPVATESRALGAWGERLARQWYLRNGYDILGTNVRVGHGEIDVIAQRDDVVAICEVKTRASREFGDPGEALTTAKQRTVRAAAFGWARANNIASWRLRFDLACVVGTRLEMMPDSF